MSNWTDERKQQAVDAYTKAEPTPENSMDIVKEIADEMGETANGVRMILIKAEAYVKKTPATAAASTTATKAAGTGAPRVSKEGSQAALKEAIEKAGKTVDDEIISKLTGKAAVYFTSVLEGLQAE